MTAEVAGRAGFVAVIVGYAASIVRSDPAVFGAIGTAAFFAGVVRGDAEPTGEA